MKDDTAAYMLFAFIFGMIFMMASSKEIVIMGLLGLVGWIAYLAMKGR